MRPLKLPYVNGVVRAMIAADFLIISSSGFLAPIGAVYFTEQIAGASLAAVGFASTVFWLAKSAFQIPVSLMADATKGERDDFWLMVVGVLVSAAVQLSYYFWVREMWQVYIMQIVDGFGYALQVPTYLAIFTRHIDRDHEGTEWMLHSNAIGLGFAITSAIGGVIAERFGFRVIFLIAAAMLAASVFAMLPVGPRLYVRASDGRAETLQQRTRPKP